jgi:dTDP-4-dehydrorhamnose reductase
MKILLTGPTGQVGSALTQTLPAIGDLTAAGRDLLDLTRPNSIRRCIDDNRPDVIINAAAYTAVDRAESEEALATQLNAEGPAVLAEKAKAIGALLVHFSTDYVFDGEKDAPYVEADRPNPLNSYGRSKLAGEHAIRESGCRHLIFRTSWIYSAVGQNFLLTILRLAKQDKLLRVVDDQFGAPTSSYMVARAVTKVVHDLLADDMPYGIYHMSATGETSWYEFAKAILEQTGMARQIQPIASIHYPTPARRPQNSRLDGTKLFQHYGVRLDSWRTGLLEVVQKCRALPDAAA